MALSYEELQHIIMNALREDIGHGDITSNSLFSESDECTLQFVPREPIVVSGLEIAGMIFAALDPSIDYMARMEDGDEAKPGEVMASVMGSARAVLAGERVALNFMQRMSGIATLTAHYVEAVKGTGAIILDTRKTVPGLRMLDKYAVRCGGGQNHRFRLDDAVLIKDNHIAIVGSLGEAVRRAKDGNSATKRIEVECDTIPQVKEALDAGADMVLLDNMGLAEMAEAVQLAKGKAQCEASGNMTLEYVRKVAQTGVDYISVGRLTHSVLSADIGLDSVA